MTMFLKTLLVLMLMGGFSSPQPTLERIDNRLAHTNYTPLPEDHWLSRATVSEFATLPWNSRKGLKAIKMPDALGANAKPAQLEWPGVSMLGIEEGKVLVKSSSEVLSIRVDGTIACRFSLPKGGADLYTLTVEGDLLIAQQPRNQKPRLIKISKAGKQLWNREGEEYAMSQLLVQAGIVYLVRKGKDQSEIYSLDPKTGDVGELFSTLPTIQRIFAGNESEFCFATYNPEEKARFWNRQVQGFEPEQSRIPNELYGTFAKPAAADEQSNAYGAFGSQLSMMRVDGQIGYTIDFAGIALGADGGQYFSKYNSETRTLKLLRKETSGAASSADLTIPEWIAEVHNGASWKLVKVEGPKYHLLGRDPQAHLWNHLIYDARVGSFVVAKQPGDMTELGEFISSAGSWGVMRNGNIILPIRTATSLRLLRLAI